jgi:hypothetical protein
LTPAFSFWRPNAPFWLNSVIAVQTPAVSVSGFRDADGRRLIALDRRLRSREDDQVVSDNRRSHRGVVVLQALVEATEEAQRSLQE